MDRIESINTERIEWCCAERGTALEGVAAATGISDSTLLRVMEGEGGLTFRQLQSLAAYFNRGVLFFLEPGRVNERRLYTPQFRTLTSQKPDLSPKVKDLIEKAEWFRSFCICRKSLEQSGASFLRQTSIQVTFRLRHEK